MSSYQHDKNTKVNNVVIVPPESPLQQQKKRYLPEQRRIRSRQITRTPANKHRQSLSNELKRDVRSQHQKRLSVFLQGQIQQMHQDRDQVEKASPFALQKISQLRSIMQLKSMSLKLSQLGQPVQCRLSEYKMAHHPFSTDSNLLHSRNTKNSPFTRSVKARQLISRSSDSQNSQRSNEKEKDQFQSIQVGKKSKYAPIKKIMLVGGSIRGESRLMANPQARNNIQSRSSRRGHVNHLRSLRQNQLARSPQEYQNDCKPWQTSKAEGVFQLAI